ncbi:MAG: TRAP transporter small permease [Propylenella sp.]
MKRLWCLIELNLRGFCLLALFSLVILPSFQVALRDLLNRPIIGLEEATRWSLIILVFSASPLLLSNNEHIRLNEFIGRLPRQARVSLERIILLLCGLSVGVVAWAGFISVAATLGTRTPTLDIPFWLFSAPMLVGFSVSAFGYLLFAFRREEPPLGSGRLIE